MEQEFKESSIPSYVWSFAKKHSGSLMAAGILAFIIWQYLKKHQSDEGYSKIDVLSEAILKEDNDMSNSGDVVGTKMIKKDEDKQTELSQYEVKFYIRSADDKLDKKGTETVTAEDKRKAIQKVIDADVNRVFISATKK